MTDTRPLRKVWSWPVRIGYWLYNFFIGPFLTKLADGTIMGSMTRWAVAAFIFVESHRLYYSPVGTVTPSEAFVIFCVLFALPLDAAMTAMARRNPEKLVELVTTMADKGTGVVTGLVSRRPDEQPPPPPPDGAMG